MITCLLGTRAQLIKMAPILRELEGRGVPYHMVLTGQHRETMDDLFADFRLCTRPLYVYAGGEVTSPLSMGRWFVHCMRRLLRERAKFLPVEPGARNIVVVHGDTFSTLLGAIAGRICRLEVGHVEAGLRSFSLLQPFPEELTRRVVSYLSDVAFCPGEWACRNVERFRHERIDTVHNTLLDCVNYVLRTPEIEAPHAPQGPYAVASIHRFENIFFRRRLATIVSYVERAAQRCPIQFVLHPATREKLAAGGHMPRLEANPRIRLLPRMGYVDFLRTLRRARFVITDGGSNQEELSYLGVPTLLMRKATERREGLESTATLWRFDEAAFEGFLDRVEEERTDRGPLAGVSPAAIVADCLQRYAYTVPAGSAGETGSPAPE